MPEQLSLDLQPKQPEQKSIPLTEQYAKLVGVKPRSDIDETMMLTAIENPEAERLRLKAIDTEDDKRELRETYQKTR